LIVRAGGSTGSTGTACTACPACVWRIVEASAERRARAAGVVCRLGTAAGDEPNQTTKTDRRVTPHSAEISGCSVRRDSRATNPASADSNRQHPVRNPLRRKNEQPRSTTASAASPRATSACRGTLPAATAATAADEDHLCNLHPVRERPFPKADSPRTGENAAGVWISGVENRAGCVGLSWREHVHGAPRVKRPRLRDVSQPKDSFVHRSAPNAVTVNASALCVEATIDHDAEGRTRWSKKREALNALTDAETVTADTGTSMRGL
jgi:hypothetical protein